MDVVVVIGTVASASHRRLGDISDRHDVGRGLLDESTSEHFQLQIVIRVTDADRKWGDPMKVM
jgi:hypothetical protein